MGDLTTELEEDEIEIRFTEISTSEATFTTRLSTARDQRKQRHRLHLLLGEQTVSSAAQVLRATGSQRYDASSDVKVVGSALFETLMRGEIARAYDALVESARASRRQARIRLVFAPECAKLAELPWESMYDPHRDNFVALMAQVSLYREATAVTSRGIEPAAKTINILHIVTASNGEGLASTHESEKLLAAASNHRCKVDKLVNPSAEAFLQAIRASKARIIHLSGELDAFDREASPLTLRQVIDAFRSNSNVGLVCINARDSLQLASALLESVPAVVAIRGHVSADAAKEFVGQFYQALLSGASLDVAVASARRKMDHQYPGAGDWALPVLFANDPGAQIVLPQDEAPSGFLSFSQPGASWDSSPQVRNLLARKMIAEANLAALAALTRDCPHPQLEQQCVEEQLELDQVLDELDGHKARAAGGTP